MRRHPKAPSHWLGNSMEGIGTAVATPRRAVLPRGFALALGIVLALGLFLSLAAPRAHASFGVDTYWGSVDKTQSTGGRFHINGPRGVAVNEATGDVYTVDTGFHRVQQFDEDGEFIRAWGFDVVQSGGVGDDTVAPINEFEICIFKAQCKTGITTGPVAFGGKLNNPSGIAVDQSNGHVYVANASMLRIEEFTASGAFVRAFGRDVVTSGAEQADEEQTLTVNATAGQYKLEFGGVETAADIDWNEPASGVAAKLNALTSISAGGGSVAVSGGPGGSGGTSPYLIKFAGARADVNQLPIAVKPGSAALSGGTGTGANTAVIATLNEGASGYEICNAAASCKIGVNTGPTGGAIGTFSSLAAPSVAIVPSGAENAGNLLVTDPTNKRVQEFSPAGEFIRTFGWNVVASGPDNKNFASGPDRADEVWKAVVRATGGKFRLTFNGSGTPGVNETAELDYNASAAEVQGALNAITNINAGGGSVTVTGGPGDATGSNPYVISFDGGPLAGTEAGEMFSPVNVSLTGGAPATAVFNFLDKPGGTGFEVCRQAALDICKVGNSAGTGQGVFASNSLARVAEDANGNIYTLERYGSSQGAPSPIANGGFRVQKFTLPGNVVTPQGTFDCADLCGVSSGGGNADNPIDLAVDGQGFLYVAKRFSPGTGNPPVPADALGSQERILKIDPSANGGLGGVEETILVNSGREKGVEGDAADVSIVGIFGLAATATGKPLYATTSEFASIGARSRVYRLGEISGPNASVATTAVGAAAVTLEATIEPAETEGPVKTLYHFEYRREGVSAWIATPSADVSIGNGSAGGESSECSDVQEAATCHLSAEIDGLELGRTYQYRLLARTSYQGAVFTTAPQEFTTEAVPPSVTTGGAAWGGPPATSPSLTFSGRVNPQRTNTTYAFEYVSQADYAASQFANAQIAPAAPISAGHGAKTLDVVVAKNGLDPNSEYRFRLVASNLAGTTTGDERSVAASQAGDRFIELVSDGDSQGADVNTGVTVSDDGERAAISALTFGDDQQAAHWIANPAISQRGAGGWTTTAVAGDPNGDASGTMAIAGGVGNAEVTERLWAIPPQPQTVQWVVRKLDGSLTPISPVLSPLDRTGNFGLEFQGGSNDFSTLVLSGGGSTLFPGEPLLSGSASNLYKVSGAGTANPSVSLLNRADGGGTIGGVCGATLGAGANGTGSPLTNAVSADGSVVYFSARAGAAATGSCETSVPTRIFKRVGEASAVEVSACAKTSPGTCAGGSDFYWGASADGSKALFTTSRQLTDSDTDSTNDLYVYDASLPASERLIQASAGEVVAGDHPTVGSGADVLGVADFAMDGSRVYLVAKGRLTADGVANANNLYVFERDADHPNGRIDFVAVLADPDLWNASADGNNGFKRAFALPRYEGEGSSRVDGDGHLFLFTSNLPLLPVEDLDARRDLYRYDDETGELQCLSCVGDEALPVDVIGHNIGSNKPDLIQTERLASEDGSEVVFRTNEQLLASDTNAVGDAYLWDDGTLSLVSGATAGAGVAYPGGGGPAISPDGKSVFFPTRATLLPQDTDNGAIDIYAARVDGGFRQEETVPSCAAEDACRTVVPPPPPLPVSPASAGITGSGNVKPKKCAKKKVLRNGKCVKKHKKNNKHKSGKGKKQSRDGSGRRAGR